jgi:hypothetical protein
VSIPLALADSRTFWCGTFKKARQLEHVILVLDGRDGAVLYRFNTGGAMNGGVVTYQVAGKQYVAATSGNATYFWRAPRSSATVTIFSLSTPGP